MINWENIDFNQNQEWSNEAVLESGHKTVLDKLNLLMSTVVLILGGLLIVGVTTIVLYKTYTDHEQISSAIQVAKNDNRQIVLTTSNKFEMSFNASSSSGIGVAGGSASITKVTVYPKNYMSLYIRYPNGEIATPYSIEISQ